MAITTEIVDVIQGTGATVGRRRRSVQKEAFHSRNLLGVKTKDDTEQEEVDESHKSYAIKSNSWNLSIPIFILFVVAMVFVAVGWHYKRWSASLATHSEA